MKNFLCILGITVLTLIAIISTILFVVGIAEKTVSMAICGLALLISSIIGCRFFGKKLPKREKQPKIEKAKKAPTPPSSDSSTNTSNTLKANDFKIKKTITCKTCGAEISPRARRCPHCGEMTPGETFSQTVIGCLFAPFIVILILIAIGFYIGFFL